MTTHRGKCFSSAVKSKCGSCPEAMGYSHSTSCRSWSAAPVNAFTLWKPPECEGYEGRQTVGSFMKTRTPAFGSTPERCAGT